LISPLNSLQKIQILTNISFTKPIIFKQNHSTFFSLITEKAFENAYGKCNWN